MILHRMAIYCPSSGKYIGHKYEKIMTFLCEKPLKTGNFEKIIGMGRHLSKKHGVLHVAQLIAVEIVE